ncbi:MAG: oligosaccharide flippase family protein [Solirubrobacteraceae bacterium]
MTELTVAVSRRRLTFATAIQIGVRLVGALLGVVVAAVLARSLSRPQFGELALALTITTLAGSLGDLGLKQVAVREMARGPERRSQIAGALLAAQLVTGLVLALVGTGVAFALMPGHEARLMAVFVMATMPVGAISGLAVASQARLRPDLVIAPMLVQNLIWLGVVLALAATGGSLALYGVGAFGAAVVQAAVAAAIAVRVTRVSFSGSGGLIVELLKLAWPLGLAGLFVTAYYRIDGVLLFHYRGATASAYYSAAYRFLDVLQIFPITVTGVLLPFLAAAERGTDAAARRRRAFELAVIVLLAVAIPLAALGAILAPGVVSLIYGGAYHRSILLLRILLPAFIPICLGYVLTSQLILHDMLRPYIAITSMGAVVNLAANVIGIPIGGAPVAAWATVGTELVVMAAIAGWTKARLGLGLPLGRIGRCLIATGVTAVAVWFLRSEPLEVGLIVAAIVYPPVLFGLRAVSLSELRALLTREAAAHA